MMQLFGMRPSPFVRKVLIFAAEKGVALDVVPAGLGRGGAAFAAVSPFGKMPALTDGDFSICDSTAIITYLDSVKPEPNLIPAEARARARARTIWYEEFGDTILQPAAVPIFFNRVAAGRMGLPADPAAADAAEAERMPPVYDYLERSLPDSGYLIEDRFTLADIAVVSPLINLSYCSEALASGRWPRARAYVEAMCARPSIAGVLAEEAVVMLGAVA